MSSTRPDSWMAWYPGDYLRDTMHLTTEEHGAYRLLIDACWLRGGLLPPSDERLASITRLPLQRWKVMRATIAEFFQIADDGWRHKRVAKELAKTAAINEQRSNAGRASAAAKAKRKNNGTSTAVTTEEATKAEQSARQPQPPSVSKETGGSPPADEQSFERWYWQVGKNALQQVGIGPARAGQLLGKWKGAGRDQVIQAINRALSRGCNEADLVAYVAASLQDRLVEKPQRPGDRKPNAPAYGTPEWERQQREAGAL